MQFTKVRDVQSPCRANKEDAGIDFFIPKDLTYDQLSKCNSFYGYMDNHEIVECLHIHPSERILIPSGIHVDVPKGFVLIAFNKSGVAHKKGLVVGSAVVDSGYQGEVHISLINTTKNTVKVNAGEKIVQFILLPIGSSMPEEVESLDKLYQEESNRGAGGFGSTDKKQTTHIY